MKGVIYHSCPYSHSIPQKGAARARGPQSTQALLIECQWKLFSTANIKKVLSA